MAPRIPTREEYLTEAVRRFVPWMKGEGLALPEKVRASCGWPTRRALSGKGGSRTIGQCFAPSCSKDGTTELFISPVLAEPLEVLATLAHELVHAAVGTEAKHGPVFTRGARAMLLEGKPTATVPSDAFRARVAPWLGELGDYPHAVLDLTVGLKKQSTRMVKVECKACGYVARTTRKWLETVGAPLCPCTKEPMDHDAPEGEEIQGPA